MIYVGLDVSGKSIVASAVNERKRCVFEGEGPSSRLGLRALLQQVGRGAKLVACEAGNQMKWIAETLKRMAGIQIHVVHPNEVKGSTESRGKTDRVEARKRAELARAGLLPRAGPVGEGPVRERRELGSARQQLQAKRVALINPIRGAVCQAGHRRPEQFLAGTTWRTKLGRLSVSAPVRLILETFMTRIDALVALARNLLTTAYGVLKSGARYDPRKRQPAAA